MPLYDYKCPDCQHRFEARHGFEEPAPACPNCGYVAVQRVITKTPRVMQGMNASVSDSGTASKDQLRAKWAEETPKLRQKLVDKLGEDVVNRNAPSLNASFDD
jgi:putative FmdB family regulatory protein